jgi:hypothetical protein
MPEWQCRNIKIFLQKYVEYSFISLLVLHYARCGHQIYGAVPYEMYWHYKMDQAA